jgi:hypothetical protein
MGVDHHDPVLGRDLGDLLCRGQMAGAMRKGKIHVPSRFRDLPRYFSAVFFFIIVFLVIQGICSFRVEASPSKDGDFGIWNIYDVEKKLNPQWKMKVGEELRFRDHAGLYYAETHVGVDYKPFKYLAMGAEYQQIRNTRTVKKKDVWYWEETPRFYLTPQIAYKGFSLEDRNMLEFRFKESTRDTMRYRNLVTLTAPWKWTRFEFQPYTANEIFIETSKNGMTEDRFFSGFKAHWWGPFYGSIFYLRDSTKNSIAVWKSLNILGTSLKICF